MATTLVNLPLQNGAYASTDGVADILSIDVGGELYFNLSYSTGNTTATNYMYAWLSARNPSTGEHTNNPAFAVNQTNQGIARGLVFKVSDNKVLVFYSSNNYQFFTFDAATLRVVANSAVKTAGMPTINSSWQINHRQNYVYQFSNTRLFIGYAPWTSAATNSGGMGFSINVVDETVVSGSIADTPSDTHYFSDATVRPVFNSAGRVFYFAQGYNGANGYNRFLFPEVGSFGAGTGPTNSGLGGQTNAQHSSYLAARLVAPIAANTTTINQSNIEWVSIDANNTMRVQAPGSTTATQFSLTTDSGNAITNFESNSPYPYYRGLIYLDENHLVQYFLNMNNNGTSRPDTRPFNQIPTAIVMRFIERQTATRWVVSERSRGGLNIPIPQTATIAGASTTLQGFECGGLDFVNNEFVLRYRVGGRRHTMRIA